MIRRTGTRILIIPTIVSFILTVGCKKEVEQNWQIIFNPDLTYGTVNDIDGNVYKTINIGTLVWMAENLRTTRYQNGDLIGTTTPATIDLGMEMTPKYQWAFNGDENMTEIYGRLYTWHVVADSRKVCPLGWHVATDDEWHQMVLFFDPDAVLINGGDESAIAGGMLKEAGLTHWTTPNNAATNESGFTALPCGDRLVDGRFKALDSISYWWTATEYTLTNVFTRYMYYNKSTVRRASPTKNLGFSVRCVKD